MLKSVDTKAAARFLPTALCLLRFSLVLPFIG